MNVFIKILKGIIIGIANIIPGLSGGMIAASFGVYKPLIKALSMFSKNPILAIISIWEYLFGMVVGVILAFISISQLLNLFPVPLTMLFLGLILGGIPDLFIQVKNKKKTFFNYLFVFITLALLMSLFFLKTQNFDNIKGKSIYLIYILIGIIAATSLIIPGLSSTTILIIFGFYKPLTENISLFIKKSLTFDFNNYIPLLIEITIIFISCFITLLILSKIINQIIEKHQLSFNMVILTILLISPLNILFKAGIKESDFKVITIFFGTIMLLAGFSAIYLLQKKEKHKKLILMETKQK